MSIPKIIFIVPYRNRVQHKFFFTKYMEHIMEDYKKEEYEIYFSHQKDERPFNRGAMKNIGFIAMAHKYPNDYKNITYVFNDVDTVPFTKGVLNYETEHGIVKHFYGYKFALGGIFSIKGGDFEKSGGFPNFWAWGCEDNMLQNRVIKCGLTIDRSNYYEIGFPAILQMFEGLHRTISKQEANKLLKNINDDGLITIKNLQFSFNNECIDVENFTTKTNPDELIFEDKDIRTGNKIQVEPIRKRGDMSMLFK